MQKPDALTHAHFTGMQLNQESPFSYACNRCKRCCLNFSITVTPFDLLRLAENLGLTTTETINRHLDGNNRLRRRKDGACCFLTEQGCAVHRGRPLVCRIYPLARHITHSGELFSVLAPVPESASEWGLDGTVASYLTEQDATLSIEGYNLYSRLHYRIEQRLRQTEEKGRDSSRTDRNFLGIGLFPGSFLVPDPAIRNYCLRNKLPIPTGLRDRAASHVLAIEAWVNLKLKEVCHGQV